MRICYDDHSEWSTKLDTMIIVNINTHSLRMMYIKMLFLNSKHANHSNKYQKTIWFYTFFYITNTYFGHNQYLSRDIFSNPFFSLNVFFLFESMPLRNRYQENPTLVNSPRRTPPDQIAPNLSVTQALTLTQVGIHRGGIDQGRILRTPRNILSDPDIICLKCYSGITLSVISNGQIFSFMFLIKMLSCKRNMSSNYNLSVNILLNFCKSVDLLQNDLSYFSCWTSRKIIVIMEASYMTRH